MKKYFNIKNSLLTIFAFACFLMLSNKVEAKTTCVYKFINFSADADKKNNLSFVVENDNGKYSYKFYDSSDKKLYDRNNPKVTDTYGVILNTSDQSNINGMSFTEGKSIAIGKDGCPAQLNYIAIHSAENSEQYTVTFYSKESEYKLAKDIGTPCTTMGDKYCMAAEYNSDLVKEVTGKSGSGQSGGNKQKSGEVCTYVAHADAKQADYDDTIKVEFGKPISILARTGKYANATIKVQFKYEDVGGSCPSYLYLDETVNISDASYHLYINRAHKDDVKFGRLKKAKMSDAGEIGEDSNDSFCKTAKGTKLLKYIKMIYTILRYAVPALIVIFSTIDFLGVVLSGDQEKMAKAKKKFVWRLIIGLLIILLPVVIELVLKLAGIIDESLVDVVCKII